MIIAIDGPAGAGKSTVAKKVAERLGFTYINTGAMYRAITWKALINGISSSDEDSLVKLAEDSSISFMNNGSRILLDNTDVTNQIRTPEIDRSISAVVKLPRLREIMVRQQRELGRSDVVSEGRDLTTVVFPHADVKIYLDASIDERAKRRQAELKEKGYNLSLEQVKDDTARRDESDKTRDYGPLKIADDAIIIDTTDMTIDQVIEKVLDTVKLFSKMSNKKLFPF